MLLRSSAAGARQANLAAVRPRSKAHPAAAPLAKQPRRGSVTSLAQATERSYEPEAPEASRRAVLLSLFGLPAVVHALSQPGVANAAAISTVFVAGSTGNTGRRVVQQLRKLGYSVRAGVRDTKKATALGFGADSGIIVVNGDVLQNVDKLAAAIGDAQAVICATGYNGLLPNGFGQVDETGTINLVNAAKSAGGVQKFVLVSSLLTNAAAVGQADNPNYKFLNLFGGVLDHKLVGETFLRRSGLDYTIVRPGGLSNEPESTVGNLIIRPEDTLFGLDGDPGREISRDTVAAVAVQALLQPGSTNKVVEVVASPAAPAIPTDQWFAS